MPQRTNFFQEVVAIVHRHIAQDASVEERVMFHDLQTGKPREVDVVITSNTAGYEQITSLEVSKTKHRRNVLWVEQLIKKHEHLPTNLLVLVSDAGFSREAVAKAVANKAVVLSPVDISEDDLLPEAQSRLHSYANARLGRAVPTEIEAVDLTLVRPDGSVMELKGRETHNVYLDTGEYFGPLRQHVEAYLTERWNAFSSNPQLLLLDDGNEHPFIANIDDFSVFVNGKKHRLCLKDKPIGPAPGQLSTIDKIHFRCRLKLESQEVALRRRQLGDTRFSQAEVISPDARLTFVATETESGLKRTLRSTPIPAVKKATARKKAAGKKTTAKKTTAKNSTAAS